MGTKCVIPMSMNLEIGDCQCGDSNGSGGSSGGGIVGEVRSFLLPKAPAGWLECNGATVLRNDFSALFDAIGDFCEKPDDDHFVLPDLRGEFLRGLDGGRGVDAGRALGNRQLGTLGASYNSDVYLTPPALFYTHGSGSASVALSGDKATDADLSSFTGTNAAWIGQNYVFSKTSVIARNAGNDNEFYFTRPHNVAVLYCIKY